jgi:hypothetical protein
LRVGGESAMKIIIINEWHSIAEQKVDIFKYVCGFFLIFKKPTENQ